MPAPKLTWHRDRNWPEGHYEGRRPDGSVFARVYRRDEVSDGYHGRWAGRWRGSRGTTYGTTYGELKTRAQQEFARQAAAALERTEAGFRVVYARQARRSVQPRHVAVYDWRTDPDNARRIRMDKTLCNVNAASQPVSGDLSTATCLHCLAILHKILKKAA